MAGNFALSNNIKASGGEFSNFLKIPISSSGPSEIPGSIALVGNTIKVRLTNQTILNLDGGALSLTLADVVSNGNSSGGDITVQGILSVTGSLSGTSANFTGSLSGTSANITGDASIVGLLYLNSSGVISIGSLINCTAIDGSLFNSNATRGSVNFTITANGAFSVVVTLPVSYSNPPQFLSVSPDKSGFDPFIQALSTNSIQIGGVNSAGGGATLRLYYLITG